MPGKPAGLNPVSVRPNSCRIRGRVLRIRPESDGPGAVWTVALNEAQDVPGSPNFATKHLGDAISLYVHPELAGSAAEGDLVSATISYRGDERGGRFAVVEDGVRRE